METRRTGVILCTSDYPGCVEFYKEVLRLPVLFALNQSHSVLTCFDMGGSYLMVEPGGRANPEGKSIEESPVWLRFNVDDVEAAAEVLEGRGVSVRIRREVWGTVGDFKDPDGNRCSLRDEATFGAE